MRRLFFYITVLGGFCGLLSCKNPKVPGHNAMAHELKVYDQAMRMDDQGTAIYAMQSLIAWDSSKTQYYDTLAFLYFHVQNYPGAIHASEKVLDKSPGDTMMLTLAANAYQNIGRFDLAIPDYEKLMKVKPDPALNYELAKCYLYSRDFDNTKKYAEKMINDPKSDSMHMTISFDDNREHQSVRLKAAAYNILGSLYSAQGQKDKALEAFRKALEVQPDFILAKQNIQITEKQK